MDKFFSGDCPEGPFILFSSPHIAAIVVIAAANILLFLFRNRLKNSKAGSRFRIGLAFVLILQEISFHLWNIHIGQWDIRYTLPFQLCSISTILCAVLLLNKSYSLYEIVYFWGIGGAMQAILTPEIGVYTFPHYRYFQFFLCHGAIIMACLYMTFVEGYRPGPKSLLKSVAVLNIYALFVGIFNKLTGANYLFICEKPDVSSLMNFLGPWPYYLISLEIAAFVIFLILYLPFIISDIFKGPRDRGMNLPV